MNKRQRFILALTAGTVAAGIAGAVSGGMTGSTFYAEGFDVDGLPLIGRQHIALASSSPSSSDGPSLVILPKTQASRARIKPAVVATFVGVAVGTFIAMGR